MSSSPGPFIARIWQKPNAFSASAPRNFLPAKTPRVWSVYGFRLTRKRLIFLRFFSVANHGFRDVTSTTVAIWRRAIDLSDKKTLSRGGTSPSASRRPSRRAARHLLPSQRGHPQHLYQTNKRKETTEREWKGPLRQVETQPASPKTFKSQQGRPFLFLRHDPRYAKTNVLIVVSGIIYKF